MTFEEIKSKYSDREPAFPEHLPKPNESDLNDLIKKFNCKFPKSFIDFQLKYCNEVPIGDFSFEGFGWSNIELGPNMNLEEILKDYSESEFPVVIFDHNSNDIESSPNYNWKNFIDWIDKTMKNEY